MSKDARACLAPARRGQAAIAACALRVIGVLAVLATVAWLGPVAPAMAGPLNGGAAPLPGSTFQGADGNESTPLPGDADFVAPPTRTDWQSFVGSSRLVTSPDPQLQDSEFQNGSHEGDPNHWDLGATAGGVKPDKANVLGAWGVTDPVSNDTFLYLAFRRSNDGNGATFYHFELNQLSTSWTNANGETIPCRKDGDVMIVYEIDGGQDVTISLLKWQHDQPGPAACPDGAHGTFTGGVVDKINGQAVAQGAFNSGSIANYLDTNFDGDGNLATPASQPSGPAQLPAGTFGEASLNLTAILGTLGDPCFNFGQIQLHSRSSPSFDSALQDFVAPRPIALRSCSIAGVKYEDANGNGTQDAGEGPLPGFRIYDDANHNDAYDAGEKSSVTAADGSWAITGLAAGTHEIREDLSDKPGWQCTDPQPCEQSVSILRGGNVGGLKFGNFRPATIVIDKTTDPAGSPVPFTFSSDVPGNQNFQVSDADATSRVMTGVTAGTYHVSEESTDGWSLASIACDDPTSNSTGAGATATINLAAGEIVTCHFVNKRDAHVTVVKDARPSSGEQFSFSTTGLGAGFSLTGDGSAASSKTFTVSGDGFGQKSITEAALQGWSLTDADCTGAAATLEGTTLSFAVKPGDDITCTVVNKKDARVTVVKDARPSSGRQFSFSTTGLGDDFSLTGDGSAASSKTLTVSGDRFGQKSITEAGVDGWSLENATCTGASASLDGSTLSFAVQPGDDITCTFVNEKDAHVTVLKDARPQTGRQFSFSTSGLGDGFALTGDGSPASQKTLTVKTGDFGDESITEDAVDGWSLKNATCTGAAATLDGSTLSFSVRPGDDITCTFVNEKDAHVTVVKDAAPSTGQVFPFATSGLGDGFALAGDGSPASQKTMTVRSGDFGDKSISETDVAGWSLAKADCTGTEASQDGATLSFAVNPGDDITCTFVNAKDAHVTVVKDAAPSTDQQFSFSTSGLGDGFALRGDGSAASTKTLMVSGDGFGQKSITEAALDGWSLNGARCTGAAATLEGTTLTFAVEPGDDITCTFVNTKDARVTVVKDARPSSSREFGFSTDGLGGGFSLTGDGSAASTKTLTVSGDGFGQKSITEAAVDGWVLKNATCTGAAATLSGTTLSFAVQPGDDVTCTFVNEKDAHVTVVKDAAPRTAQDFPFATSGLGDGFALAGDGSPASQKTLTVNSGGFGDKSITEAGKDGWSLKNATCTGAAATLDGSTLSFTVQPGDDITCTFVNEKDAHVTVVKEARPQTGGSFAFSTIGLADDFALAGDGSPSSRKTFTVTSGDFGEKSITEAATPGWDLTGLVCASGDTPVEDAVDGSTATLDVRPGDDYICTFTNTQRGEVSVHKSEGTPTGALTRGWTFHLSGGPDEVDQTDKATPDNQGSIAFDGLRPGDYTLCEESIPAGWHSSLEGIDGALVTVNPDGTSDVCVTVTVAPGQDQQLAVVNRHPGALVVKEGNVRAHHGDTLTFTFDVSNAGNAPLHGVTVHDDHCPDANVSPVPDKGADATPDTLDPGDHWVYTCTMPVPPHAAGEEDPIHNTVTATATDDDGHTVTATDGHTTDILHPGLALDKKVRVGTGPYVDGPVEAYVGDTLDYRVTVRNTGDAVLSLAWGAGKSAAFVDPRCDKATIAGPAGDDGNGRLDPGETWTYTCSHRVTAHDPDPLVNVVQVTGTDDLGGPKGTVTGRDSTKTDVLHPAIAIAKRGPATATAGQPVTYVLDVTNPGDVAFAAARVAVTDALCQAPPALSSRNGDRSPGTLDHGDRWTYTCQVRTSVGQTRVDNIAQVAGTDRHGHTVRARAGATTRLAAIQVAPVRVRSGSAHLRGPKGCMRTAVVRVTVTGKRIEQVTFRVDGRRVKTLTKAARHGRWTLAMKMRKLALGRHRVQARVKFAADSQTAAKVLRFTVSKCGPPVVAPQFTG
jgi:uncharacterized repeat protein (TIGR01451 family)